MNEYQELWWQQAVSDHDAYQVLRGSGTSECHTLHYLQMTTEKLAKAYFWRSGSPPPKKHAAFVRFLRFIGQVRQPVRGHVARLFGFSRFDDLQAWIRSAIPLADELQHIAPALAGDGPNTEYPWPHTRPAYAPATFMFPISSSLDSLQGRQLMKVIHRAVSRFPEYADL